MRLFVIISIILPALAVLYSGIHILDTTAARDVQIFELKKEVKGLEVLLEDCVNQLGVFYMPPTKGGTHEKESQIQ